MRRSAWQFLAAGSVLLFVLTSSAAVRPRYGGTLRVLLRETPSSLDPHSTAKCEASSTWRILPLIFDRLTSFDNQGQLQPQLAAKWQSDSEKRRWQFWLRRGVKFHDGSAGTATAVAASLRTANPEWSISAVGDSLVIETPNSHPSLPAEMALPCNGIVRPDGQKLLGTGPFRIQEWQPGKKLVLIAVDEPWDGRAFIDRVEINFGQNLRQQKIALELGNADLVEVAPEQAAGTATEGRRVAESAPAELVALLFSRAAISREEMQLRRALSLSLDRTSMARVLLQGQAEAAASILPNWMTGFAFLFASSRDLPHAQQLRTETHDSTTLILSYDPSDTVNQLLAERIALNAREAGIVVQPTASLPNADLSLVRLSVRSPDPRIALAGIAAMLGAAPSKFDTNSWEELYRSENDLLQSQRIIPLLHVPQAFLLGPVVNGWQADQFGTWHLKDVWLQAGKP